MLYSVKDKNNLTIHNVWTGTDYKKNIEGLSYSQSMQITSTTDWASNGTHSIKTTSTATDYSHLIFAEVLANTDETYLGQISILNNSNSNVYLRLVELENNQYNDVTISPSGISQEISISRTINRSSTLRLLVIIRVPVTVYVDNVRLCKR